MEHGNRLSGPSFGGNQSFWNGARKSNGLGDRKVLKDEGQSVECNERKPV